MSIFQLPLAFNLGRSSSLFQILKEIESPSLVALKSKTKEVEVQIKEEIKPRQASILKIERFVSIADNDLSEKDGKINES